MIGFGEIEEIKPCLLNGIKIFTKDKASFRFSGFTSRDQTFDKIQLHWAVWKSRQNKNLNGPVSGQTQSDCCGMLVIRVLMGRHLPSPLRGIPPTCNASCTYNSFKSLYIRTYEHILCDILERSSQSHSYDTKHFRPKVEWSNGFVSISGCYSNLLLLFPNHIV